MPRIYKPTGPSANKAINPVNEVKDSAKKPEPAKANKTKKEDGGQ